MTVLVIGEKSAPRRYAAAPVSTKRLSASARGDLGQSPGTHLMRSVEPGFKLA